MPTAKKEFFYYTDSKGNRNAVRLASILHVSEGTKGATLTLINGPPQGVPSPQSDELLQLLGVPKTERKGNPPLSDLPTKPRRRIAAKFTDWDEVGRR